MLNNIINYYKISNYEFSHVLKLYYKYTYIHMWCIWNKLENKLIMYLCKDIIYF